jgi:hypothetical protein
VHSLLDELLPVAAADAAERHATHVRAAPAEVLRALWSADLAGPASRALLALRLLPAAIAGSADARTRLRGLRGERALTLDDFRRAGFTVIGQREGHEVVLGLTGRFWSPSGGLVPTDARTWAAGPPAGTAQAAWSFRVTPAADGATLLDTETRVRCADEATRRAFARYWLVVRPFSGLLRRAMLRAVRREAERAGPGVRAPART